MRMWRLSFLLLILLFSCKDRYEDGNDFSLRSHDKRLCKEWELSSTGTYFSLKFDKDNSYTQIFPTIEYKGTWKWKDDFKEIELKQEGKPSITTLYEVQELSKGTLHLSTLATNNYQYDYVLRAK